MTQQPTDRRSFLKAGLAGAATAALTGCPSGGGNGGSGPAVQTQKAVRWRLASSFPKSLDTIYGAADKLAARVKQLTGGKFEIRCYAAGELVPGLQVLDAVQGAQVQIGHSAGYYYKGKNPALSFDTTIPFGLDARQHMAWMASGGMELLRKEYAEFGVINLPGGNTGVQMGGWFREPVETLKDLEGLKMRIPGMGGEVMDKLGATVQVLAGGDIYPALERGAIDATEWVGPYDDQKLGFHQVAKNYYYPGWWEPGPALSFYVNAKEWEKLPDTYRAALEAAAAEAAVGMQIDYDAKNPPALQSLLESGVTLRPFSEEIMVAARDATAQHLSEIAGKEANFKAVYDHWQSFRKASNKWLSTAELTYGKFAYEAG
jgi:TRAP-type mannitol/chloroaromatic compound transport system substrate-binding protein